MSDSTSPQLTAEQEKIKSHLVKKAALLESRVAQIAAASLISTNLPKISDITQLEENIAEKPYHNSTRLQIPHKAIVAQEHSHTNKLTLGQLASDEVETLEDLEQTAETSANHDGANHSNAVSVQSNGSAAAYLSLRERWSRYKFFSGPPSLYAIIGNELCERFSHYAMKAILVLYFQNSLGWSKPEATVGYALTNAFSYVTPILGGMCADTLLGKYSTIILFSCIYICGSLLLAISAGFSFTSTTIIGLFFISLGVGGIKPVVGSFGADQYTEKYFASTRPNITPAEKYREIASFFTLFYVVINIGAIFSLIIIPTIRSHFSYAVAFSIPAVLLAIATLIFISGTKYYYRAPLKGSLLGPIFRIYWRGLKKIQFCRRNRAAPAVHWLDRAADEPGIDKSQLENAKSICRVVPIFLCIIMFWCLQSQEGSVWVIQAAAMNTGGLEPEQMQFFNPVQICLLLPIADRWIYPKLPAFSPLRRIGVGMLFTVLSFIFCYFVQVNIDNSAAKSVPIWWQLPQISSMVIAEILISVTGLQFAYSQAPAAMKSVIASLWFLTNAAGNLITAIAFGSFNKTLSTQSLILVFIGMMAINSIVYAIVAKFTEERQFHEEIQPELSPNKPKNNENQENNEWIVQNDIETEMAAQPSVYTANRPKNADSSSKAAVR
jgi:POT family proton-dependent oligopeptide transporter